MRSVDVPRAEGVYFAGWTRRAFSDELPAGGFDAVIGKLVDGDLQWFSNWERTRRPGDGPLDRRQGSVRHRFHDRRTLDGTPLGESDGFLRKYR